MIYCDDGDTFDLCDVHMIKDKRAQKYNNGDYINGKEIQILRANFSFKGISIPPGLNIVDFKFGARWRYILNYFLLFVFYSMFLYLIFLGFNLENTFRYNVNKK